LSIKVHQLFANTVWKMNSQNARIKNKHPVFLNVAIKTLFILRHKKFRWLYK